MTRTIEERIEAATSDIAYEHRLDGAQSGGLTGMTY